MFQSSVPYGSQQLPVEHDQVFVMPWLEQLATQSEELNVEHEGVLRKLNSLLSALNTSDRNRIAMACTNMSAEARAHFAKEEEMMHAADYPERAAHIEYLLLAQPSEESCPRRRARFRARIPLLGSRNPWSKGRAIVNRLLHAGRWHVISTSVSMPPSAAS